jgi:predicted amidophosphoribosyltransferase
MSPMNATLLQLNGIREAESRRLVGLERHYRCDSCGGEHRSWSRVRSCPDCGEALTSARIRRAALA